MSKPNTVIVKRGGAKFEAVGTLAIAAAIILPFTTETDAATAIIIGGVGFLVFIVGRFL